MNTKIIGSIITAGVLIGTVVFLSRAPVSPQEIKGAAAKPDGCPIAGSGQCQADNAHQPSESSPNTVAPSSQGVSSHDFTLEKLGGGTITLAEYRGQKPVIVDFWASWCPNCRRDMPKINRWYKQYRDRVEVIGINLQESPDTVQQFVQSNNIAFPIALDSAGVASTNFGIQFTNTHFLFSKSGELVRVIPGDIKEADIVSLLES